jgi:hypothetical protein
LKPGNAISCILALKFMLSILVSEIKEGKNAQNIKKLLTLEKRNLSPKLNNPQKFKKKKTKK